MNKILQFLDDVRQNNNREWFQANKERYLACKATFDSLALRLIEAMGDVDTATRGLSLADCTYRFYRDTRFSPDKSPYKTHFGVYVCPGGKKSGRAGYYLHVEPAEGKMLGQCGLHAGLYNPDPKSLKSIREDIALNGQAYADALRLARGFSIDAAPTLKRVPAGYPADHPHANLLKLKDFSISTPIPGPILLGDDLVEHAAATFARAVPFNQLLNRAVDYARGM